LELAFLGELAKVFHSLFHLIFWIPKKNQNAAASTLKFSGVLQTILGFAKK
jgi:hypothetical protein